MQTQAKIVLKLKLIRPEEFRDRTMESEATVQKMYSREQMDDLLAQINSTQETLQTKFSKHQAEFENLMAKNEGEMEKFGNKAYKLNEKIEQTQSNFDELQQDISRIRQAGANNTNVRKRLRLAAEEAEAEN